MESEWLLPFNPSAYFGIGMIKLFSKLCLCIYLFSNVITNLSFRTIVKFSMSELLHVGSIAIT